MKRVVKIKHEAALLEKQLNRLHVEHKHHFRKITNLDGAKSLVKEIEQQKNNGLFTVVYNFVDMISHAKSEMEIIKELASDDKGYRSLTESWFKNSPLFEALQKAKRLGYQLLLTTDHGTINVKSPLEVKGDKKQV